MTLSLFVNNLTKIMFKYKQCISLGQAARRRISLMAVVLSPLYNFKSATDLTVALSLSTTRLVYYQLSR